jgi:dTDP-4-dehydrorhamnose reductase
MPRLMVTGAGGMTGTEVRERARAGRWEVSAFTRGDLDITDGPAVEDAARRFHPDVLINCAAYTAVDRAESDPELAAAVNAGGTRNVAHASSAVGAPLIHVSTDYVFSGSADSPYSPDSRPGPTSVYGETKLAGEIAVRDETADHVIVRTSWVFSHRGSNFVRSMLRLAGERDELRVVNDQTGRPTSAADLADALLVVAEKMQQSRELRGTYHFANSGETTWFGFANAIFEEVSSVNGTRPPRVIPIPSDEYPTAALRPRYSVLDTTTFTGSFGVAPRPWREALRDTIRLSLRDTLARA